MLLLVATWNVHRCVGLDGRRSVDRVAAVIREIAADVVALQEVECAGAEKPSPLATLAAATGLAAVPGPIDERRRGGFGNALLTHLPVRQRRNHNLSVPRREARAALDVELDLGARCARVIATHLGLVGEERTQQVMQLLSILDEEPASATLLLGDFNEWRPSDRRLAPLHRHLGLPPLRPATFPATRPLAALDRVWCRPHSALLHVRAHASRLARAASDHLPLVAVVKL